MVVTGPGVIQWQVYFRYFTNMTRNANHILIINLMKFNQAYEGFRYGESVFINLHSQYRRQFK